MKEKGDGGGCLQEQRRESSRRDVGRKIKRLKLMVGLRNDKKDKGKNKQKGNKIKFERLEIINTKKASGHQTLALRSG